MHNYTSVMEKFHIGEAMMCMKNPTCDIFSDVMSRKWGLALKMWYLHWGYVDESGDILRKCDIYTDGRLTKVKISSGNVMFTSMVGPRNWRYAMKMWYLHRGHVHESGN